MVEWRYSSTILDLGTRCRQVVGFTPRPFYPLGKSPLVPIVVGGWVGPKAGLGVMKKREIFVCN
jgi:hypothetical protein